MLVKTIIIGARSNLSQELSKRIDNSELVSAKSILDKKTNFFNYEKNCKYNLIINAFYPASKLSDISNPKDYIENTLYILSLILEEIKINKCFLEKINKIIYTSSASVYGNNNVCHENDSLKPLNLQGSLKIASEKLIESFCKRNNINYTITRLFNMYGGVDHFSIVSKIIDSVKCNKEINLINHCSAIRDYIHIDDVVSSYIEILSHPNIKIVNIGTGDGIALKTIIDYLTVRKINIKINHLTKEEIKVSIANVDILSEIIDINKFVNVIDFISNQLIEDNIK